MEPSKDKEKKEKSRVRKYIKRLMIVGIILSIPVFIVWYGWVNTFFVVVPPKVYSAFPEGAILWSYWDDRADGLISQDFIQEVDTISITILLYNYLIEDLKPMVFPYNETIHQIATGGIGKSIFDLIPDTKQDQKKDQEKVPEVVPYMDELDDLKDVVLCGI